VGIDDRPERNLILMADLPNVIPIVLDTVRADRLSRYGHHLPTTPNLDRFARESVLYRQAIAPACWTLPSHASLFTGLYPSEHGAETTTMPPPPVPTLAELLRDAGYATIALCRNPWMGRATELQRGFADCPDVWVRPKLPLPARLLTRARNVLGLADTGARKTTELVTDRIRRAREPYFLFVNYMDVHPPSRHTSPFLPPGIGRMEAFVSRLRHISQTKRGKQWDALVSGSPRSLDLLNHMYDNDLHYLDANLGVLFDFLSEAGRAERTLLIVTSDHGETLGEHNLLWHFFSLHDTLVRVPLIVRWLGVVCPGTVVDAQVQLTDILPTLAGRLGMELAAALSSGVRPPLDILDFDALARDESPVYAEHRVPPIIDKWAQRSKKYDFDPLRRDLRAIRTRKYKYIAASRGEHALFDLTKDPGETANLIHSHGEVASSLARDLQVWAGAPRARHRQAAESADEDLVSQRLQELGYL